MKPLAAAGVLLLAPIFVAVWWFGMQAAAFLVPAAAGAYFVAWMIDKIRTTRSSRTRQARPSTRDRSG